MSKPFSDEVPLLLEEHLAHLRASAISTEVIRERGYESVLGRKRLADLGFSKAQRRIPGILIPLHGPDGSPAGCQYRPDAPRLNTRGKAVRYENPTGSQVRLDVPPRCRAMIGDPKIPVWFVEGTKKADALASLGACAIGLGGVWSFRGRNPVGGTTVLADFDYLSLRGRVAYIAYDSDYQDNPQVRLAQERLAEHLRRKGCAEVKTIYLPPGPQGGKVGVDDYLVQGHGLKDLIALADKEQPSPPAKKSSHGYVIEEGRICWLKPTPSGEVLTPLCNFNARVVQDLLKDSGLEQQRFFLIEGSLGSGKVLTRVQLQGSRFNSMNWVPEEWGSGAIIAAGMTLKDRLREAIQLQSQDAAQRRIFTHTGWREAGDKRGFLTSGGALGLPEVEVELEPPLNRYMLPMEPVDDKEAVKASLDFLDIGKADAVIPIWAAMYLAPLSEVLDPAFTLWVVGPTGTFKSTLQALALCHFGAFTVRNLPASWRDTANYLEKVMALAKDVPLVIDDWAPAPDTKQARELEVKAEQIARAQGNRLGRGRLRSDTSTRVSYIPRGVVITNGEQFPGGQSHTARLFSVELEPGDIDMEKLTAAQGLAQLYPIAMAGYIRWLAARWHEIAKELRPAWNQWCRQAQQQGQHPRVPEAVAWLYAGFNMGMNFIEEVGVLGHAEAQERREWAWDVLLELGDMQGGRVEEERPGHRFMEGLRALLDEGRVLFRHKDEEPAKASPSETQIGWSGDEGLLYLNPYPAHGAVYDFWRRSGEPLTFKANAVWKDLRRMGLTVCADGRTSTTARICGQPRRVIALKEKALHEV